jgi:hypothetical protein
MAGQLVGSVTQDADGRLALQYDEQWRFRDQPDTVVAVHADGREDAWRRNRAFLLVGASARQRAGT